MKKLLLLILFIVNVTAYSQQWQWAYPVSSNNLSLVTSVSTDSAGNPYFMGTCSSSVTFNAQNGTFPMSGLSMFVTKYDAGGNKIWVSGGWGAANSAGAGSMTFDHHSDCYLTGGYSGTVSFGIGVDTLQRSSFQGTQDYFLLKLDKFGKPLFINTGGNGCSDAGTSVTALTTDELISFWTDETICNMASAQTNHFNKLNSNGTTIWSLPPPNATIGQGKITPTTDGGFVISNEWLSDTICFHGMSGSTCLAAPVPSNRSDVFLTKYSGSGNVLWAKAIRGKQYQHQNSITTDMSDNILLAITGEDSTYYDGTLISQHDTSVIIIKANAQGNLINHISFPVFSPGRYYVTDIKTDPQGNVFLLGDADSDIMVGTTALHFNQRATVLIKLDANLNYVWSQYMYSSNQFGTLGGRMAVTDSLIYLGINHNESVFLHGSTYQFPAPVNSLSFDCFFAAVKNNSSVVSSTSQINNQQLTIQISPNPSSGIFTIHKSFKNINTKICVYDLLGNCVFEKTGIKNDDEKIDLSANAKGIYFVKMQTGEKMFNQKIIVE